MLHRQMSFHVINTHLFSVYFNEQQDNPIISVDIWVTAQNPSGQNLLSRKTLCLNPPQSKPLQSKALRVKTPYLLGVYSCLHVI